MRASCFLKELNLLRSLDYYYCLFDKNLDKIMQTKSSMIILQLSSMYSWNLIIIEIITMRLHSVEVQVENADKKRNNPILFYTRKSIPWFDTTIVHHTDYSTWEVSTTIPDSTINSLFKNKQVRKRNLPWRDRSIIMTKSRPSLLNDTPNAQANRASWS